MCFAFVPNCKQEDSMGFKNDTKPQDIEVMVTKTIPESGYSANSMENRLSSSLIKSFQKAFQEGRLASGLLDSAQMLDSNPDEVMYCILPSNTANDITLHLHIKLMEAFCWENEIPLIKVDDVCKLAKMLPVKEMEDEATKCFLVKFPEVCTEDDECVMEFYEDTCDLPQQPALCV